MKTYIPFNIKEVLNSFYNKTQYDLDYIIKLHTISTFINSDEYCDISNEYTDIIKKIPSILGKYASNMCIETIVSELEQTEKTYHYFFMDFLSKYKVYERIPWEAFKLICSKSGCTITVFEYKNIVSYYDNNLLELIKNENRFIEMILADAFSDDSFHNKKIYLPSNLSPEIKEEMTQKYINSDEANPNYLNLIYNSRGTPDFPISDKTRLFAKKKYMEFWQTHINQSHGLEYGVKVSFKSIPDYVATKVQGGIHCFDYSHDWIKNNLDFPTLLNNFIHLFEYCDAQFRFDFVPLKKDLTILEAIAGAHGKKDFQTGIIFDLKNKIHRAQIMSYCDELEQYNIYIQDVLKWFFEEYLKDEFGAENFVYIGPSKSTTFLEKCILLSCAIDSILKQFEMYGLNGCIDRELLEISSNHMFFENIKGFANRKYAYLQGSSIGRETYLLFSKQSYLNYTDKIKMPDTEFYLVLAKGNIKLSDFKETQHNDIFWLIERGSIFEDENGFLKPHKERTVILRNLFYFEALNCSYVGKYRYALDELIKSGDVIIESTFFSRQEQEYLNFMLNNSKHNNGPALRNNYVHGTYSLNPKKWEEDYYELLKIMIMIIIKINEEFCLKYPENKNNGLVQNQ